MKLPLAFPEIMLGLNQTIMMALAMTAITALIGSRDLGQEILKALPDQDTGRGVLAGLVDRLPRHHRRPADPRLDRPPQAGARIGLTLGLGSRLWRLAAMRYCRGPRAARPGDPGETVMKAPLTVACVQLCADLDTERNLATLRAGIAAAAARGARLVALPEYCAAYGDGPSGL